MQVRKFTSVSGRRFRRASRWAAVGPARRVCSGPDAPGCNTAWTQPSVGTGPCDWSQVDLPGCPCRASAVSCVPPPPDGADCAAGRSTSTCLRSDTRVVRDQTAVFDLYTGSVKYFKRNRRSRLFCDRARAYGPIYDSKAAT